MRALFFILALLAPVAALAGPPAGANAPYVPPPALAASSAPSGACSTAGQIATYAGSVYQCSGGSWATVAAAYSPAGQPVDQATVAGRTLGNRAADVINVLDNGVVQGHQYSSFVTVFSSTPNAVKINSGAFTQSDVGSQIFIAGIGASGQELATTIASVTDATHIVISSAAQTFVTATVEQVTYGPDTSGALSTLFQKWIGMPSGSWEINFPPGVYVVTNPINMTQMHGMVTGYGALIYGATSGNHVFDASGLYGSTIRGFTIIGDPVLSPDIGLIFGRYVSGGRAFGLNSLQDITINGAFTTTPLDDMASESSIMSHISTQDTLPNTFGAIFDGSEHFGESSTFVTYTLPADTAYTFTNTDCQSCRFTAPGTGSGGMWISAANDMTFQDSYTNSTGGCAVTIYQTANIRAKQLDFHLNSEVPQYEFCFDGSGSSTINRFSYSATANLSTGSIFHQLNSNITNISLRNLYVSIDGIITGSKIFDNVTPWTVTGDIYVLNNITQSTLQSSMPTTFSGHLSDGDNNIISYGLKSADLPLTNIPISYGAGECFVNGVLTVCLPSSLALNSISASGGVTSLTLSTSGFYSIPAGGQLFPSIVISAPGGSGTQAGALLTEMHPNGAGTITNGGSGYAVGDYVTPVGATPIGGVSSATAFRVTAVSSGAVTALTPTTAAYSSLPPDVNSLSWNTVTGSGSGLVTHGFSFKITQADLTAATISSGSGYTSATVSFASPTGVTLLSGSTVASASINSNLTLMGAGGTGIIVLNSTGTELGSSTTSTDTLGPETHVGVETHSGTETHTGAVQNYGAPINAQTGTAYTLVASDCGKTVTGSNSAATTFSVPSTLPVPCRVAVLQAGTGAITVAPGSGETVNAASGALTTAGQWAGAIIRTLSSTQAVVTAGGG